MTTGPPTVLFDGVGQSLQLGRLLGKGGEGAVYEVSSQPNRVAKVYHDASRIDVEKLAAMVRLSTTDLAKISAWPEKSLHQRSGGPIVGYVMPRASGTVLYDLLGPGSRKAAFPFATYPFVVRTALNLARAFAVTHHVGAVISDVKALNAQVNDSAIVTLIDTDGFQITDTASGKVFFTKAVTPEYQPPELQGVADFSRLVRTPQQDAFGLAVLIFELLFMGRHPFQGVPLRGGDLPPAEMIKQRQFTYALNAPNRLYGQPPGSLPLIAVGPIRDLFERAFLSPPAARPSAADWVVALGGYERGLVKCQANPTHAYFGTPTCLLCKLELQTNTVFFLGISATSAGGNPRVQVFNIVAAWAQIESVHSPGPVPPLPSPPPSIPTAEALSVGSERKQKRLAGKRCGISGGIVSVLWALLMQALVGPEAAAASVMGSTVFVLLLTWIVSAGGAEAASKFREEVGVAKSSLAQASELWNRETGDNAFQSRLNELERAKDALVQLEGERKRKLAELHQSAQKRHFERFLQTTRIVQARIPQISPTLVTTLRSFGVETAYDIYIGKLNQQIPQIGPVRRANLMGWSQYVQKCFRFDPSKGVDPQDIAILDLDMNRRRAPHEQTLRLGPAALRHLKEQAERRRLELLPEVQRAVAILAQATANAQAVGIQHV